MGKEMCWPPHRRVDGGIYSPIFASYGQFRAHVPSEAGARVFQNDERIRFSDTLPRGVEKVDIVHLGSSLQYIEDWRALIGELARYRPHYFLLTDLLAGDIPTYATAQNYYGSKIPCWFFNIQEIISTVAGEGFRALWRPPPV